MGTNVAGAWDKAAKLLQESSTMQPDSVVANTALRTVQDLTDRLEQLPSQPKAVWKKLVQQLKVPLQLGVAFASAAQHSWQSPATQCALYTVNSLLRFADAAGVLTSAGSSSLCSSIRHQLEQSGMLQQLTAVMSAIPADLQAEAAACAAGAYDADKMCRQCEFLKDVMHAYGRVMGLWASRAAEVDAVAWVCHPSGHAAASMQLITAALQHASALTQHLQHLLPQLQQRAPQEAQEVWGVLQSSAQTARALGCSILAGVLQVQARRQQQGRHSEAGSLQQQQLLLSPHLLRCATVILVLSAGDVNNAVAGMAVCSGWVGRSSSSSIGGKCGTKQREPAPQGCLDGSSSRTSSAASANLTACQLRLLQLLDLGPELPPWDEGSRDSLTVDKCNELLLAINVCSNWCLAAAQPVRGSGIGSAEVQQQQQQQQQQRQWDFEQQVMRLLPTVLLPCASSLLSHCTGRLGQPVPQQVLLAIQHLLQFSNTALYFNCVSDSELSLHLEGIGGRCTPVPDGWVHELQDGLLQLADQLLYQQQPPIPAKPAAAAAAAAGSSACAEGSSTGISPSAVASCVAHLLPLLWSVLHHSCSRLCGPSNRGSSNNRNLISNSSSSSSPNHATAGSFGKLAAAAETVLRAVTVGVQSGLLNKGDMPKFGSSMLSEMLLSRPFQASSLLMRHMGLCEPEARAQEQRQLYSLLSTVLKLGRRESAAAKACWGEQTAGSCCLAAAQAAVSLLLPPPPVPAAAAAQQPAVSYLPSLVIFGRCCLQWAEQLQQQAPELLLPASGTLQQEGCRAALLHECSAALVCIPALCHGAGLVPGDRIERLAATVSQWVAGLVSPVASAQLEAAGCDVQQVQQQLQALLSAQQGTQQGLTDASLAGLVQQLQGTGAMLCNVAVPHFCNNPACGNISGPTEVRLVSGRSCICAGCRTARYCGRDCQRAAWKQHKPVCTALAVVFSSTAGVGGS